MRIVLAAIAALILNVMFLVRFEDFSLAEFFLAPSSLAIAKDLLLLLLSFYILIDALIQLLARRNKPESRGEQRDASTKTPELAPLKEELEQEQTKKAQAEGKLKEAQSQVEQLERAVSDLEARLASAEKQAGLKQRPRAIDTEIINLLAVFQEKGRLIDFLMDDVTPYSDAQVGAAARVVHQGAGKALKEYFSLQPVTEVKEGEAESLDSGYDSARYRLLGKVEGEPPFSGNVLHRGWEATKISLPRVSVKESEKEGPLVIAPAEIEVL